MSTKNLELVASFAGSVFQSDADGNPIFATSERHVRKTAKSAERTVSFQKPVLAVSDLAYYIKRGEALAEIPTEHVTKVKNEDGSTTETKRISNALSDLVADHLRGRYASCSQEQPCTPTLPPLPSNEWYCIHRG